jgi:hypothetical protein
VVKYQKIVASDIGDNHKTFFAVEKDLKAGSKKLRQKSLI